MPRFHMNRSGRRRCGGGRRRRHGGGGGGLGGFLGGLMRNRHRMAISSGGTDVTASGRCERRVLFGGGHRGHGNRCRNRYFHYGTRCGIDTSRPRPTVCPFPETQDSGSDSNDSDGEEEVAPKPDPTKTLMVKGVDFQVAKNTKAHFTSEYEVSGKLVVRRGQCFDITITFNRPYDPKVDDCKLVFEALGSRPTESKGTSVKVLLSDADEQNKWGAKILSNKDNTLTLTIFTPSTLFVGKWELDVEVMEKDGDSNNIYAYNHPDPIYVIFNPWCKNDTVYLENDQHRNEYVLQETGRIFSGSSTQISAKPWNFGQFEADVLDAAFYLLDAGRLQWTSRGNPVSVIRKMTAMVNSSDDGGVLTGNWSGNYSGGRSPLSWTGSSAIIQKYYEFKKPVKYGQCWVFSGLTTTLLRTIGIAARSITNFASAHDTDGSITIDRHFTKTGEPDEGMNSDSIWNFHVWNEAWIARPDLTAGYGGWQACDATPQEASDGTYVCGPVPVQAIKQGEVNLPYDGPFVFAEVNADIVNWITAFDGSLKQHSKRTADVGKFISTKAVGSLTREDVTHCYKHPEGSAEERAAVMRANQTGSNKEGIYGEDQLPSDVSFTVDQDAENTWVGGDFVVSLRIKNNAAQFRNVDGRVTIKTMYYTGVSAKKLISQPLGPQPIEVKPGQEYVAKVSVPATTYVDHLKDCCMIDVTYSAIVVETQQVHTSKDNFALKKPNLTVKGPNEMVVGNQFFVDISFVNPLEKMLTKCVVEVDGLSKSLSFSQGNVKAKGTFSAQIPVTATKMGHKEIVLVFTSKELDDINCYHPIFIKAA